MMREVLTTFDPVGQLQPLPKGSPERMGRLYGAHERYRLASRAWRVADRELRAAEMMFETAAREREAAWEERTRMFDRRLDVRSSTGRRLLPGHYSPHPNSYQEALW